MVWHPVAVDSCEAPFLLQAESKTSKTVSSSDRACQQLPLSSWPHQAGRTHSRTWTWADINHDTQCKHNLLANKQSALHFFYSGFCFSLHLWVFWESHDGLIRLIVLPDTHPVSDWINEGQKTYEPHVWICFYVWCHSSTLLSVFFRLSPFVPSCLHPSILAFSLAYNLCHLSLSLSVSQRKNTRPTLPQGAWCLLSIPLFFILSPIGP